MSLKAKLATTIAALCMVICLLTVGVFAASKGTIDINGSVSYTAKDIQVKIAAAIDGTTADYGTVGGTEIVDVQDGENNDTVLYNWDFETENSKDEGGNDLGEVKGEWKPVVSFEEKTGTITLVLKVQNLNTERKVNAKFAPTLAGTLIAEGSITAESTEHKGTDNKETNLYAAVTSTATVINEGATQYFTIQLKIVNPNDSVDEAVALLGGSLTLADQSVTL